MEIKDSELLDNLEKVREGNAKFHYCLARDWYFLGVKNKLHSPLVYSAFEYRIAIERYVFEFMILIKREEGITKEDENKAVNLNSLISYIYKITGGRDSYKKALRFNSIILSFENPSFKLAEPDLDYLKKKWNLLSDFCHLQIKPNDAWIKNKDFFENGYKLLEDMKEYFYNNTFENVLGWFAEQTIPHQELLDLRNEFITGKISESSFKIKFDLMRPILNLRGKLLFSKK